MSIKTKRCPGCGHARPLTGGHGYYVNPEKSQVIEVALCRVCGAKMDTRIDAEKISANVKNYFRSKPQESIK